MLEITDKIFFSGLLSFVITMEIITLAPHPDKFPTWVMATVVCWWTLGVIAMILALFAKIWTS